MTRKSSFFGFAFVCLAAVLSAVYWASKNLNHFKLYVFPDMSDAYAEAYNSVVWGNHDFHLTPYKTLDPEIFGWAELGWVDPHSSAVYKGKFIEAGSECDVGLVFPANHSALIGLSQTHDQPGDGIQSFKPIALQPNDIYVLTDGLMSEPCVFRITKDGQVRFGVQVYPFPN